MQLCQVAVINAVLLPWPEALTFNYSCWGAPRQQEIKQRQD